MEYYDSYAVNAPPSRPHSGLGITSFVIAIVIGLLEFILFVIAGILEASTPNGIDENSPVAILLGLALIGGLFIDLLGVVLGSAAFSLTCWELCSVSPPSFSPTGIKCLPCWASASVLLSCWESFS